MTPVRAVSSTSRPLSSWSYSRATSTLTPRYLNRAAVTAPPLCCGVKRLTPMASVRVPRTHMAFIARRHCSASSSSLISSVSARSDTPRLAALGFRGATATRNSSRVNSRSAWSYPPSLSTATTPSAPVLVTTAAPYDATSSCPCALLATSLGAVLTECCPRCAAR